MRILKLVITVIIIISLFACKSRNQKYTILSPDGNISVIIENIQGQLYYSVSKNRNPVILPSKLGFKIKDQKQLGNQVKIIKSEARSFNETWEQPWGEKRLIENKFDEITIYTQEFNGSKRKLNIIFRAYNDGIGFRYEIPQQEGMDSIVIMDELTEFTFANNHKAWWIPAYRDNRYEYLYKKSNLSELDTVHTPLTIETVDGLFLSVHEANLTNYSSMTLVNIDKNTLKCDLVPWSNGDKVRTSTPMYSPWRTLQIAETSGDLITSYLILNLNEPCKIEDVSWIKPSKYIGIWWGIHIDKYTWSQGEKHGATTQNVKEYIDFAANNGISGVLVEGWNEGWDRIWAQNGEIFSFTTPYPDFDIEEITEYAKKKNVNLIGHHETGAAAKNYEDQLIDAFNFYNKYGINTIKTGYVGTRLDHNEWHHGQYGVKHYRKIVEMAAKYNVMLDVHEPIKGTGIRRTYPNMMTREGARGQEYDAWSPDGGNPPDHTTILPFTRLLAGPMDFTPGTFDILIPSKPNNRVNTTLAKQLALFVIIYSPLQMASDLPENYENNKAFDFIKAVPVDWEDTRVLDSKIGDYVVIVRKDRNSDEWYLGAITDENSRELSVDLSFLTMDIKYQAQIYADGDKADWETNPLDFQYFEMNVSSDEELVINLASGGGQAIRFNPIN